MGIFRPKVENSFSHSEGFHFQQQSVPLPAAGDSSYYSEGIFQPTMMESSSHSRASCSQRWGFLLQRGNLPPTMEDSSSHSRTSCSPHTDGDSFFFSNRIFLVQRWIPPHIGLPAHTKGDSFFFSEEIFLLHWWIPPNIAGLPPHTDGVSFLFS